INAPPSGPGTEAGAAAAPGERLTPGFQGEGYLGSGFTDTYGFGLGARAGYTFPQGFYVGGAVTHYWGHSVTGPWGDESAHATFGGGEGAYQLYVVPHVEVRPYGFLGPGFIKTVDENPFRSESRTRFAVQPGVLGAYHFGNAFLSAEAKWHLTPEPH